MNEIATVQQGECDPRSSKKDYSSPVLVRYGDVAALTKSGTNSCTSDGNNACGTGGLSMTVMTSDENTKENIVRIGTHPISIGLYLFDYKPEFRERCGCGRQFGVIAQEVEVVMPEAVSVHPEGYKMVNYAMLGISRNLH